MDAYQVLQNARDFNRPSGKQFIKKMCSEFVELRGDRHFGDDKAIIGGIGRIGELPLTIIAMERGEDLEDRARRNFGSAHPEGYRKALRLMQQAEKFHRPVLCMIDTSGAFCGIGAEERGQGHAIAQSMMEIMTLKVPVITVFLGEGESGGAIALGVADRIWMLENSVYSVISPEGCASILWNNTGRVAEAAECLKITPDHLLERGFIDKIIPESPDTNVFQNLKSELVQAYSELKQISPEDLLASRYQKFREFGTFRE